MNDLHAELLYDSIHPCFILFEFLKKPVVWLVRQVNRSILLLLVFNKINDLLFSRVAVLLGANKKEVSSYLFVPIHLNFLLKEFDSHIGEQISSSG